MPDTNANLPTSRQPRWFLAWLGFFLFLLPLTEFVYTNIEAVHPSRQSLPGWYFAAMFAGYIVVMNWLVRRQKSKNEPIVVTRRPGRRYSRRAFAIASFLFVMVVGSASHLFLHHPSWPFIFVCAVTTPLGCLLGNFVLERAGEPLPR